MPMVVSKVSQEGRRGCVCAPGVIPRPGGKGQRKVWTSESRAECARGVIYAETCERWVRAIRKEVGECEDLSQEERAAGRWKLVLANYWALGRPTPKSVPLDRLGPHKPSTTLPLDDHHDHNVLPSSSCSPAPRCSLVHASATPALSHTSALLLSFSAISSSAHLIYTDLHTRPF